MRSDPPGKRGSARFSNHWIDPILSERGVIIFWLLYAAVHGALRLLASDSLAIDDARASEVAQNFALGYQLRQPPLYEWLLLAVQQVLGAAPASLFFLRYLLIAAVGIATFAATRALTGEQRWAAAASLSLAMMYPVAWAFHDWGTHTLLLSIACIASLHAAVNFIRRPSLANAVLLGLAIGLGLMAKFTYLLFLGGLLLAVASLPETRGRFADRRLLLSCAIALLCAAPYLYWLADVHGDLVAMASTHLVKSTEPHMMRALTGLAKLAWSLAAFLMPWLLLVALLAWPAFRRNPDAPPPSGGERIARRTMLFAALLAATGIVALGVTNIGERYMHAILMIAPVYVFARIARAAPNPRSLQLIMRTSLLLVAIALVVRFVSFFENDWRRSIRSLAIPYDGLAAALVQRGVTDGTLIATGVREAGNMRAQIPALRVLSRESLRVEKPPRRASDARSCVLLWRERDAVDARLYGADVARSGERIEVVTTSFWGSRHGVWLLARLDPGVPSVFVSARAAPGFAPAPRRDRPPSRAACRCSNRFQARASDSRAPVSGDSPCRSSRYRPAPETEVIALHQHLVGRQPVVDAAPRRLRGRRVHVEHHVPARIAHEQLRQGVRSPWIIRLNCPTYTMWTVWPGRMAVRSHRGDAGRDFLARLVVGALVADDAEHAPHVLERALHAPPARGSCCRRPSRSSIPAPAP